MDREPLPDVQFGDEPESDDLPDLEDDADDDDEELAETPADVVEMLGFDPLDEDDS